MIQWWASVGIVACYWSAGEDSHAEDYYSCIEALSGDGAAVPSTLQLAFKANVMHKRPSENLQAPLDVILQLCAATSNSLKSCVTDLLQDNTSSTETELHQVMQRSRRADNIACISALVLSLYNVATLLLIFKHTLASNCPYTNVRG